MRRWAFLLLLVANFAPAAAPPTGPASVEEVAFFEKKIRPLLHTRCFSCHSAEAKKSRGGLLLDTRAGLLKGGDTGPAIVPGDVSKSLLMQAVRYEHEHLTMPPSGKLPPAEVALFAEWVRRGAVFPGPSEGVRSGGMDIEAGKKFWSFQPLKSPTLPVVGRVGWGRNRVDAFVLAGIEKQGLTLSPEADRRTLLRRVYFDLIGLPPTPEEVDAFVNDHSADAYERVVDKLLSTPQHGERWGRFWLDLARYCDVAEQWVEWKGSPHLYRDWVVTALNADLPYDMFVRKQLAADLMPNSPAADKAALGYLGLSPSYWKELKLDHVVIKGVVAEEWEERIHTLSSTFLGLTAGCARCHDHKFDPITQRDYYALAGVFASVRQADVSLTNAKGGPVAVGLVESSLHVEPDGLHKTKLIYKSQPQDVHMQIRGNPATMGDIVPRRFVEVLSPSKPRLFTTGSGRLDLANAIVEESAALAARVMVNRVWAQHFGRGIVATPSDFGSQGDRPTHPELLDDLAARFVANGWSLKWLHREMVLSSTYRQSSRLNRTKSDLDNRWLARGPVRKLDVESWRDAVLAVSGALDARIGGASMDLAKPENNRRTLYGTVKRRELSDVLRLHDFPDPTTHSAARTPTTTPLQQLFVLNSPFVRLHSQNLARRAQAETRTDEERIERLNALLFNRKPTPAERGLGREFVRAAGWEQYAQVLLATGEFAVVE